MKPQSSRRTQRKSQNIIWKMVSLRTLRLCGKRRIVLFFLSPFFLSFTPDFVWAESSIQQGIADYRQQNFKQAEAHFSKAQKDQPENPKLNYNLANSHYKNGKYQEALKSYDNASSSKAPSDLQQKSLYNSGNALYRMGKLEESIATYKKVLEMNSGDMDAKFNLEYVREKLKEKEQQDQKQNQPKDGDSQGHQNPEQNPEQNPSPENNSGDPKDNSAQQENQEPAPPQKPDPSSQEQKESKSSELAQDPENPISKDQAEQWLSGLDEDLKKFSQKQAREKIGDAPVSFRDW